MVDIPNIPTDSHIGKAWSYNILSQRKGLDSSPSVLLYSFCGQWWDPGVLTHHCRASVRYRQKIPVTVPGPRAKWDSHSYRSRLTS